MMGYIGGVTLLAMLLSYRSIRPGVVLFWALFVIIALLHGGLNVGWI